MDHSGPQGHNLFLEEGDSGYQYSQGGFTLCVPVQEHQEELMCCPNLCSPGTSLLRGLRAGAGRSCKHLPCAAVPALLPQYFSISLLA